MWEKNLKKNVCITGSLYWTHETNTLQINYTPMKLKKKKLNRDRSKAFTNFHSNLAEWFYVY